MEVIWFLPDGKRKPMSPVHSLDKKTQEVC